MTTDPTPQTPTETTERDEPTTGAPRNYRRAQIIAAVAGVLGVLLAVATPLLPVTQSTAALSWPQGEGVGNVAAPLVSFVPVDMDLRVPCSLARDLPASGGVLMSTTPAGGQDASARGLFVRADASTLTVTDRDVVILSTERAAAQDNSSCTVLFHADEHGVNAKIDGTSAGAGSLLTYSTPDHEMRPQIVGVYTDLPASASRDGLSMHATIDTRYVSSPTPLKLAAIIVASS